MTTSNKAFSITPGAGDTTAGFVVGSANFQAMVQAGSRGHMLGTRPTYIVQTPASVLATNKHHMTIFNGAGSGVELTIQAILAQKNMAAVTGAAWELDTNWITAEAGTPGGTLLTAKKYNQANGTLPSQVAIRAAPTGAPTESTSIFNFIKWLHSEETNLAAQMQEAFPIWPPGLVPVFAEWQDIVLAEGQGLTLKQISAVTAGTYYFAIVFTTD